MESDAKQCYFKMGLCTPDHRRDLEREVEVALQSELQRTGSIPGPSVSQNLHPTSSNNPVHPASGNNGSGNAQLYHLSLLNSEPTNPPTTPPQALASENVAAKGWTLAEIQNALWKGQTDVLAYLRINKPAAFEIVQVEAKLSAVFCNRTIPESALVYLLLEGPDVVSPVLRPLIRLLFDCSTQVVMGGDTARCEQAAMYSGDDVRALFDGLNRHGPLEDLLSTLSSCQRGKLVGTQ